MFKSIKSDRFVYPGCHNKIPLTGWFKQQKRYFLTVLEAGKSRIKLVSPAVFFPGLPSHSSLGPSSECTQLLSKFPAFYKDINQIGLGPKLTLI